MTFKPDVDDIRESPALKIINELIRLEVNILACDPNLSSHSTHKLYLIDDVLLQADFLVILVAHWQFKRINLSDLEVLDFCGLNHIL